ADRAEDRARANCDSAHNAKIAHNAKSRQLKCRRDHVMRHRVTWRRDGIRRLSIDLVIHLLSFKWGAPQRTKIHPPKLFAWAFPDAPAIHSPLKVNSVSHRSASFGERKWTVCRPSRRNDASNGGFSLRFRLYVRSA